MSSKIYKKGTKYKLHCCTHDFQSDCESDVMTLEYDATEEELEAEAREFMEDRKQPEWWFEVEEEENV